MDCQPATVIRAGFDGKKKLSNMTTQQIKEATENMTFEQAYYYINTCGLKLDLIYQLPTTIMWQVLDNKEITHISNNCKDLTNRMADVQFVFNS